MEYALAEETAERQDPANQDQLPDEETHPDFEEVGLIMLSAVARMRRRRGIHVTVDVLQGARDWRVTKPGFDELSVYGLLRWMARPRAVALMKVLIRRGLLTRGDHRTLALTDIGQTVMTGDRPFPPDIYLEMEEIYHDTPEVDHYENYRHDSPTLDKTLSLIRRGLSPADVAETRGMAESTVVNHLNELAARDYRFDLSEFVDDELLELLRPLATDWDPRCPISPIIEALDEEHHPRTIRLHLLQLFQLACSSTD